MNQYSNPTEARRLYVHFGDFSASTCLRTVYPARRLASLRQDILLTESRLYPKDKTYVSNGTFVVQRLAGQENLDIMKTYLNNSASMGYKIVYDTDDLLTEPNVLNGGSEGDGVPEYNCHGLVTTKADAFVTIDIMRQCHGLTASTETLKNSLLDIGFKHVSVVPNRLERKEWDIGDRTRICRQKPLVLFNGGPSHWREKIRLPNGTGLKEHPGDFEGWEKFLVKWTRNNWIELHVISDIVPYFLKDVESSVIRHDYVSYMNYPLLMKEISPDFVLCPLKENKFNKCKSDLKALEAVALNAVPFGSVFGSNPLEEGPYGRWKESMVSDAAEAEDRLDEMMKPQAYQAIVEKNMERKKGIWMDDEFVERTVKPAWFL